MISVRLAKHRCHQIYVDKSLNKSGAVICNIHQSFIMAAMKMHAYLQHLGRLGGANAFMLTSKVKKGHVFTGRSLKARRRAEGGFIRSACGMIDRSHGTSSDTFLAVIHQVIRYTYASIRSKTTTDGIAGRAVTDCTIQEGLVTW